MNKCTCKEWKVDSKETQRDRVAHIVEGPLYSYLPFVSDVYTSYVLRGCHIFLIFHYNSTFSHGHSPSCSRQQH